MIRLLTEIGAAARRVTFVIKLCDGFQMDIADENKRIGIGYPFRTCLGGES